MLEKSSNFKRNINREKGCLIKQPFFSGMRQLIKHRLLFQGSGFLRTASFISGKSQFTHSPFLIFTGLMTVHLCKRNIRKRTLT